MTVVAKLRHWAEAYTEEGRFSPVGVIFHWVMALMIIIQLGLGWYTTAMLAGGDKMQAFQLHSALGLAIFVLALFRIAWRILVKDPFNDADTAGWRTKLAYVVEHLFYLCFLLLPLTGWAMWSAVAPPGPLSVGGLLPWPQLPLDDLPGTMSWHVMYWAETIHLLVVWLLMLLIPLHIGAALKHHFWDRSDVLSGMLPDIPDWERAPAGGKNNPQAQQPRTESDAG